jgi:hypothetical protein
MSHEETPAYLKRASRRLLTRGERIKNKRGVPVIAFFRSICNGWFLGLLSPTASYYRGLCLAALILSATGLLTAWLLKTEILEQLHSTNLFFWRMD